MPFTKSHIEKIDTAWKKLIADTSYLQLYGNLEENADLKKICTLLTSEKKIKNYLDKEDIVDLIRNWVASEGVGKKSWDIDKKIKDVLNKTQQSKGSKYLIEVISGTPYNCHSFFPLSTHIPEVIETLKITDDIEIITKEHLTESFPTSDDSSSLISLALLGEHYTPDAKHYFHIKTKGYPGPYGNGQAIKEANKKLRELLFLLGISKFAEIHSYKKQSGWPYCFYISQMEKKERRSISISQSTMHGLINLDFKKDIWEPAKILRPEEKGKSALTILGMSFTAPEKDHPQYLEAIEKTFSDSTQWLRDFQKAPATRRKRLSRAIEWGFMGEINRDEEAGFIQTCIALEAILGEETKIESNRLFDRAAYMLGKNQEDRENIFEEFKQIYNLRSAVVHGKKDRITSKEKSLMTNAEYLLRRILWNEIHTTIKKAA